MSYGLQASEGGFWDTNSTYDQPVYEETIATDIATQSQDVTRAASNDSWTEFFKNTVSTVFDYAIKKDAAVTGAELQRTVQQAYNGGIPQDARTQYRQPQASGQILPGISNTMLLIGLGIGFPD